MRSSSKKGLADVARSELIGLAVEVRSPHPGWNGLAGTIRDETKNTFLVETAGSEVLVPKTGQEFVFRIDTERFVVRGADIQFQPEDRIKKYRG